MTSIGSPIEGPRAAVAFTASLAVISLDWWLIWFNHYPESGEGRWALAFAGCAIQLALARGNLDAIGLVEPIGGWRRWLRICGCLLAAVVVIGAMAFAVWRAGDNPLPQHLIPMRSLGTRIIPMCLLAPLLEEAIYRVALCVGVAALLGGRWAIVVSGIAFAVLHLVYGNPSPENQLGGFFLAWAYIRSGSIYVPLILHSAGNGLVLSAHLGANVFFNT